MRETIITNQHLLKMLGLGGGKNITKADIEVRPQKLPKATVISYLTSEDCTQLQVQHFELHLIGQPTTNLDLDAMALLARLRIESFVKREAERHLREMRSMSMGVET